MKSYQMRLAKPLNLVKMLTMKVIFTITLHTIFKLFDPNQSKILGKKKQKLEQTEEKTSKTIMV